MARPTRTADSGTAIIGTILGATIVLLLLLFAVQVIVHLYATSVVTSAAFDAAQMVATSPGDQPAQELLAERDARRRLGSLGDPQRARFTWLEADGQQVVLRVQSESPQFIGLPEAFREITKTVTVRTERFR